MNFAKKSVSRGRLFFFLVLILCSTGCREQPPAQAPQTPHAASLPTPEIRGTSTPEPPPALDCELRQSGVSLKLPWDGGRLYRSYSYIHMGSRENRCEIPVEGRTALDEGAPDGVVVHYLAQKAGQPDVRAHLKIPNRALPPLSNPELEIRKLDYTLPVLDNGRPVKRYPVALGGDPEKRKFCQDMKSTPEGWYEVYNLQPVATYFKALDLDYPRPIDSVRHQLAIQRGAIEPTRPIGGEIQIHGWGIAGNWTAGCIALRDEDMTEIFNDPAIRPGLPVFITGSQVSESDRPWLRAPSAESVAAVQTVLKESGLYQGAVDGQFGNGTALALGRYQVRHGLPDSCQLDRTTRRHFHLEG